MPKPKHSKTKGRRSNRSKALGSNFLSQTVILPFRTTSSKTRKDASGYEWTELDLTIANFVSDRVAALAPFYEFWRIKRLRVSAFSSGSSIGGTPIASSNSTGFVNCGMAHGIGFLPSASADFGAMTTFDDLNQLPDMEYGPIHERLTLHLGPAQLYRSQPLKWFHTKNTGSIPAEDLSCGSITYVTYREVGSPSGTNSPTEFVQLTGEIELKAPLEDSLSASYVRPSGEQKEPPAATVVPTKSATVSTVSWLPASFR